MYMWEKSYRTNARYSICQHSQLNHKIKDVQILIKQLYVWRNPHSLLFYGRNRYTQLYLWRDHHTFSLILVT